MAKRIKVAEILAGDYIGQKLTVAGWVRSFRSNRFIALNDGSTIKTLQIVIDFENYTYFDCFSIQYFSSFLFHSLFTI